MKKQLFLKIILINLIFISNAHAKDIYSCVASSAYGDPKDLLLTEEKKFYPTIIIEGDSLTFVYSKNDLQFKSEYKILDIKKNQLVGIHKLEPDYVDLIHFNLKEKVYSTFYSDGNANTLKYGKCSDGIKLN